MWLATTLILGVALVLIVVADRRQEARYLDRAAAALRAAGDDGVRPNTLDGALDRLERATVVNDEDLTPRRAMAALDQMSTGAVLADETGEIIMRNRVAAPFATGRHGDALVEAEIQARLGDALRGEVTDAELRLHGPPERVLFIVGSPLVIDGEVIGAIVRIDDVSEEQRLDAMRRDFVANVSHELRTPVGALSLLAETLDGEEDPAVVANFLGRIHGETHRLNRLIDDLLDLSRIEAGAGDHLEEVSVVALIDEVISTMRGPAERAGVTLGADQDANADVADVDVIGDRAQLFSALSNLVDNAIKYSADGDAVHVRLAAHGGDCAIAVVDEGVGIPQRDLNRIFERFYRVDKARSSETGGTGLGLSIVRHVAANHGGRVEVVSQEGIGSTFTLILPTRATSEVDVEAVWGGAR